MGLPTMSAALVLLVVDQAGESSPRGWLAMPAFIKWRVAKFLVTTAKESGKPDYSNHPLTCVHLACILSTDE